MKKALFLAATLLATIGTNTWAQTTSKKIGPRIEFAKTKHDFGRVEYGESVKYSFAFTNTGDDTLKIHGNRVKFKGKASCKDTQVLPRKQGYILIEPRTKLAPGRHGGTIEILTNQKKIELVITWDLSQQCGLWKESKNGKIGLTDKNGHTIIPFEYEELKGTDNFIREDIMRAKKSGKWGLIDKNNRIIIPFIYDSINQYEIEKGIVVARKDRNWGVVGNNNRTIIPFEYERIYYIYLDDLFIAKKNGKSGIIDKNNRIIIPFEYDAFKGSFNNKEEIIAEKNGKRYWINKDNKILREWEEDIYDAIEW